MKKILALLLLIIPSLINCNKSTEKINTIFGINKIENRLVKNINRDRLISLMNDKATFMLIQTTKNCHCSTEFVELVNQYIKETGLLIYSIDYEEIKGTTYNITLRDNAPTFHIILKGNNLIKYEQIYSLNETTIFNDYQKLKNYLTTNISTPIFYYIDEEELDTLYDANNKNIIYYAKSNCSECEYLTNIIINDYAQTHTNLNKMYIFDFANYETEKIDELRNKYGLAESTNNKWGYMKGALPIMHLIDPSIGQNKNDKIEQAFMFGNDILNENYVVTNSYYNNIRLENIKYDGVTNMIGKKFNADETTKDGDNIILKNSVNDSLYKKTFEYFIEYANNKL